MSYLGNYPNNPAIGPSSLITVVATSTQTSFSVTYTPGFLSVFQNGVLLLPVADYVSNNGTTVVLSIGATVGDELTFMKNKPLDNISITLT